MSSVWAQTNEVVLHNFGHLPTGANPIAGAIRDPTGNLYGTTSSGGPAGAGVVYKLDAAGHQTVLYGFTGGADGAYPTSNVIGDWAGNLYGTTQNGGTAGAGVVFKVDGAGHESVIYTFTGGVDGGNPSAGLIRDAVGNLYGTAQSSSNGCGVVFKVSPPGIETVLYAFTCGTDGAVPYAGVVRDSAGNLYGTTPYGGSTGNGNVFKIDPSGNETVLYSFTGGADGGGPYAGGVILDSVGNLYGTASYGGSTGNGNVFKVDPARNETVLYSFTGGADGGGPNGVIRDSTGNFYGTASYGGANGDGDVFKVDSSCNETVLYSFTGGADGGSPQSGVIRDPAGDLYGTTIFGGPGGAGVVYQVDTSGHETVLYGFPPSRDGASPEAGVIGDSAGNLFGTTVSGGSGNSGVVYEVDLSGQLTILYNFTGGADGGAPGRGSLVRDSSGSIYGTATGGGSSGHGVVFKVDAAGNETVLYSFTGGADGATPTGGLILDQAGNFYGTTTNGGASNFGVVYKLDPSGSQSVLHTFTGGADGAFSQSSLILDSAGNLYGTTSGGGAGNNGTVFKVDGSGNETVLYSFTGGADGGGPYAAVIRDSAGNLYGTTTGCTGPCFGTVYKLDPTGNLTVLHSFTGFTDGGFPFGSLVNDSAGNLYGTTYRFGVVFKLDTSNNFTVLATGLGEISSGVTRSLAGNLFGTASVGGKLGGGFVFALH